MTYTTISKIATDPDLRLRIATCAAIEKIRHPYAWLDEHIWEFVGQPGWGDAYNYAVELGNEKPGEDVGVISDSMILGATQAIIQAESPAPAL